MQCRFDLVIYGATGFTGCIATKHLMASPHFSGMRVAIAGRNKEKLAALQAECERRPEIMLADSTDQDSVNAMVRETRVILNFAGPYAWYAEPVIRACAEQGKDYLDITGETVFIRKMIDQYQEQAKASGARLIPFCGFDSVPADLTAFLALQMAAENHLTLNELHLYYQIKGGFNGGTLATFFNMAETDSLPAKTGSNILVPDASWPTRPVASSAPRFERDFSRWSVTFFMKPINNAVVERSTWMRSQLSASAAESEYFEYDERILMPRSYGCLQAYLTTIFAAGFGLLSQASFGRELLRWFSPRPGEGPSEAERLAGFFRVQLVGRVAGHAKVKISMERAGDPGNEITSAIAIECARLAVEDRFVTDQKGFLTPTVAFGMQLHDYLESAGFAFQTELVDAALIH